MIFNDFEALKKRKILENQHKIHILIKEWDSLFTEYFNTDVVRTDEEVETLLKRSKELDAKILKLSN